MKPSIQKIHKEGDILRFTLSQVDVSIANAIRRTALSDITTVIFRTSPHEQDTCTILANTTRLNNEIIKQRLSCIPIHIRDATKFPYKNFQMEVQVENLTDTIMFVTSENFQIKNKADNKYLSETQVREIFPPDPFTGHFVDLVRLRPKVSEQILGDKIHLTCDFSLGTAKENGMYNVVSTCSYGFTQDEVKINSELAKKKQQLKDDGKTEAEISYDIKNWLLLDAKRIVEPNSFDFVIQSVGVFDNEDIVTKSVDILIQKLRAIDKNLEGDKIRMEPSKTTMDNCYDVILENEDYTIGKAIEYILFSSFFEKDKTLTFVGFIKMHPHDAHGVLRLAFIDPADKGIVKKILKEGILGLMEIFEAISARFPHAIQSNL